MYFPYILILPVSVFLKHLFMTVYLEKINLIEGIYQKQLSILVNYLYQVTQHIYVLFENKVFYYLIYKNLTKGEFDEIEIDDSLSEITKKNIFKSC